jgi:hypothetical protein
VIPLREAAQRLDIPIEMARRHGLPAFLAESDLAAIEAEPPAWLRQSRENRLGKRPVWVELRCDICGFSEQARPKKWWPQFTYLTCEQHAAGELPDVAAGMRRGEIDGIGSRFIGVVDEPE